MTDTSKITAATDELSGGLAKGGEAAKKLGSEIANAIKSLDAAVAALDGRVATLEEGGNVEPPDPPVTTLTPSGSIRTTASNQVIENKDVTGRIEVFDHSGVTIRNCRVKFPGQKGLHVMNGTGVTIKDCEFINSAAASGQNPNAGEDIGICLNNVSGTAIIDRCKFTGCAGIYAVICKGMLKFSFLEGHNLRAPLSPLRGQLVQINQCSGGALTEDFSVENDPANSRPADLISVFTSPGQPIIFRRGLLDGCNDPAGVACMVESTSNVLFEDVDALHQGNGAFSVYGGSGGGGGASQGVIYRRCRVKDTIQKDQGRGPVSSNYCTYVSSPGCSGTRFEVCKHFNVKMDNLFWDASTMALRDCAQGDFTPRAPIRNVFGW